MGLISYLKTKVKHTRSNDQAWLVKRIELMGEFSRGIADFHALALQMFSKSVRFPTAAQVGGHG